MVYNFFMQRADVKSRSRSHKDWINPFSKEAVVNLAGTEMHTNYAMLRHFWWETNALWPSDLSGREGGGRGSGVGGSRVYLSERDEIVPTSAVMDMFRGDERGGGGGSSSRGRARILEGASHGDFIFDGDQRDRVIRTAVAAVRLDRIVRTNRRRTRPRTRTTGDDSMEEEEEEEDATRGELLRQQKITTTSMTTTTEWQ